MLKWKVRKDYTLLDVMILPVSNEQEIFTILPELSRPS